MIRLTIPSIDETDLEAVRATLDSGYLVQGVKVSEFERVITDYTGAKYAVAVSNCTAALHLSLLSLDVRPGDLVLVSAYSFIASANVIELCGAQPIFIDILPDTFNMDPVCLEAELMRLFSTSATSSRVKAIIPVHAFGQSADMPRISELANHYQIPVIEDAACALGARIGGKQAGTWGKLGCFSFHPRKAVTTGEGGIIITDDLALANLLRALRNHGQNPESSTPDFITPGFNYRLTEFQAALGVTQMSKLDSIIASRRRLAAKYNALLDDLRFQPPVVDKGSEHVYQSYVILLPEEIAGRRQELIVRLKEKYIETTIGTWHMPLTAYFRTRYGYQPGDFPVTDNVFARSLTLPIFETLSKSDQEVVVDSLASIADRIR
jgi:perosamine synthetase